MSNFFDFREQITPRPAPRAAPAPAVDKPALTVSQLTSKIDGAIRTGVPGNVLVKGEISRPNLHRASGHLYFTMKDSNACIDAVMWKSDASRLKFNVENGLELLATGKVQVYAPQGKYQLYVTSLAPIGAGALELALKQLRAKLEAEGLFAPERKKPLPMYPRRIAIVTSRSTAALHDILKVLARYPFVKLFLYPVPVQGDGAGQKIAAAIAELSRYHERIGGIDMLLLARGGGSLEDLWQFNEEVVARAIAASVLPIITGIGHEIDTSIADLVADYHAHTPTEAATVAIANWSTAGESIVRAAMRLHTAVRANVNTARGRLAGIERHEFFRRPTYRIDIFRQLLDHHQQRLHAGAAGRLRRLERRLEEADRRLERRHPRQLAAQFRTELDRISRNLSAVMDRRWRFAAGEISRLAASLIEAHPKHQIKLYQHRLNGLQKRMHVALRQSQLRRGEKLHALAAQLHAVSPTEVLRRGYSITMLKKNNRIVRSSKEIQGGEKLLTRLADGEIESTAHDPRQVELF